MENIKYIPMLYSTPMVQALLDDRKNQTRRIKGLEKINENPDQWSFGGYELHSNKLNAFFMIKGTATCTYAESRMQVGDIIWVRETFLEQDIPSRKFVYKADYSSEILVKLKKYQKWKPSLFMEKEACRIFLKVISVKVERLVEISEADAIAEGVEFEIIDNIKEYKNYTRKSKEFSRYNDYSYPDSPITSFLSLWELINGVVSLGLNPWVWVIKFKRIEKPLDFI